jgi:hypothetical protein
VPIGELWPAHWPLLWEPAQWQWLLPSGPGTGTRLVTGFICRSYSAVLLLVVRFLSLLPTLLPPPPRALGGRFLIRLCDLMRASSGRNGLICRLPGRGWCLGRPSTKWGGPGRPAGHTAARSGGARVRFPWPAVAHVPFWLGDFPPFRRYHTSGVCSGIIPHQCPRLGSTLERLEHAGRPPFIATLAILVRGYRSEICFRRFAARLALMCAIQNSHGASVLRPE